MLGLRGLNGFKDVVATEGKNVNLHPSLRKTHAASVRFPGLNKPPPFHRTSSALGCKSDAALFG